jgi:hypothetical protein
VCSDATGMDARPAATLARQPPHHSRRARLPVPPAASGEAPAQAAPATDGVDIPVCDTEDDEDI